MATFTHWIQAARPRTLTLSICAIALGVLPGYFTQELNWLGIGLAAGTALLLQLLSNLANDLGDSEHGADLTGRVGEKRAVAAGLISKKTMKQAVYVTAAAAFASGLFLLWFTLQSSTEWLFFLALGIAAIAAAIAYTNGKRPYGYVGLGDLFVFIFFGLVSVLGTHYLLTHQLHTKALLPAISFGCLSVAILNVNNIRDIESDTKAGKNSIPVRIGASNAITYQAVLFAIALGCMVLFINHFKPGMGWFLTLFMLPWGLHLAGLKRHLGNGEALDSMLPRLAASITLFTITTWIIALVP